MKDNSFLKTTCWITGPLALFDLVLGITILVNPDFYLEIMHMAGQDSIMLARTAVVWLFFSLVEFLAFFFPIRFPSLIFVVAVLRIMDVTADLVYLGTTTQTPFGKFALIFSPVFNIVVGLLLIYLWERGTREFRRGI